MDKEILDKLKQHRILPSDTQHITIKESKDIAKQRGMTCYSKKSKKDLAHFIIVNSPEPVNEIRESKSALRGFSKEYVIDGWEVIDTLSFLNIVQPHVVDLLSKNRQIQVNLVLWCTMERIEVSTGEVTGTVDFPFRSKTEVILEATDVNEVYYKASEKIKESIAEFLKNGSGWRFRSVVKFEINTATFKPIRGHSYIPLPKKTC